ncbi:hypothetical protein AB0M95_30760 [Sphaerisporangium sp. NPDC051017]|uniref:hypothetical protein n=1 Tax=Sphaerisporangium sp. NPDC051017 TaxID=3154636 RepID=UPI00341827F4
MGEPKENIGPLTVDSLLARCARRITPVVSRRSRRRGRLRRSAGGHPPALPAGGRRRDPGAIVIERNHLEWRLDPASLARIPEATCHDVGITWDELAPVLRVGDRRAAQRRHARLLQTARDRQALDAGEDHLRVFCE